MEAPVAPRTTSVVNRTAVSGFIDGNGTDSMSHAICIEPTTRSDHEILRQATVRHEYPVALNQSEAVPTNHTEPRRSKRDGKGQWHSKHLNEEQAEQLQKEEQRRLEKRENRVQKMGGALRLPEIPRPVPDLICSALRWKIWLVH
jgi:hypothetical protein